MGVIHYAINTKTGEAYELGKGCWYCIADEQRRVDASDVDRLTDSIRKGVISERLGWDADVARDGSYARSIAESLYNLGPQLDIKDDSSWDEDYIKGLRVIGTRYL